METATSTALYEQAKQQWEEVVDLGLHGSEDIVYGIMPLLVKGLEFDPHHLPSLDLLSDLLMEIGACDEALEVAEKLCDLAPDELDYQQKRVILANEDPQRRRTVRAYLRQKRQRLIHDHAVH